jgi:hypothetical protein
MTVNLQKLSWLTVRVHDTLNMVATRLAAGISSVARWRINYPCGKFAGQPWWRATFRDL